MLNNLIVLTRKIMTCAMLSKHSTFALPSQDREEKKKRKKKGVSKHHRYLSPNLVYLSAGSSNLIGCRSMLRRHMRPVLSSLCSSSMPPRSLPPFFSPPPWPRPSYCE